VIHVEARLRCDKCAATYLIIAECEDTIRRSDLARLRRRAATNGWRRMRPSIRSDMRDYCSQCAAIVRAGRLPESEAMS
jgi:hypothetical protein